MKRTRLYVTASALILMFTVSSVGQCSVTDYLHLLRPRVLRQLSPELARLVNELPDMDRQNKKIIGRLFAHGGLGRAKEGKDGVWRAHISVQKGQFLWEPAIIVMPRGGELELEFSNPDPFSHHAAFLPSNGDRVSLFLPQFERGQARLRLDGPGLYWFGCPVANHAGRGMLGLILVGGEVPDEAKLDRPKQKRP